MSSKINKLKQELNKAKKAEGLAQAAVQKAANGSPAKEKAQAELKTAIDAKAVAETELEAATKAEADEKATAQAKADAEAQAKLDAEAANSKKSDKKKSGPSVEISCATSRRRAGMKFGPKPVTLHKDDLNEEQWIAINNDKMLKVALAEE